MAQWIRKEYRNNDKIMQNNSKPNTHTMNCIYNFNILFQ